MGGYTAQSADPCQQSASCRTTPGFADKCRSIDPFASIGGICRRRFTVPKYLGSMVRLETKNLGKTLDCSTPLKPDESALHVRGLTKRFDRLAVDALDLTVRTGWEFYALLGPNGAGKTTTLRMVAGLLRPDAGTVSVLGIDALHQSGRRQADHGLGYRTSR